MRTTLNDRSHEVSFNSVGRAGVPCTEATVLTAGGMPPLSVSISCHSQLSLSIKGIKSPSSIYIMTNHLLGKKLVEFCFVFPNWRDKHIFLFHIQRPLETQHHITQMLCLCCQIVFLICLRRSLLSLDLRVITSPYNLIPLTCKIKHVRNVQ